MKKDRPSMEIEVRDAVRADVVGIHALIAELADFEDLRQQFVATVADLERGLIGEGRAAEALVAVVDGEVVGYAIFFMSYSTFIGESGLWLEDLYVKADLRGKGVGTALITRVAGVAQQRGCQRFEWSVLDWNQRAIEFYESLGAEVMPDWRTVRLDREGIEKLGHKKCRA
ncbi:MAG: GNAT family N-acetyltransferase [Verrucomicrobiales bacterium]|nr:GNAT family N-acetyltransferase [Verrucomicrobiales bacterium]